jgi:excinuclease ABC subunit C
MEHIAEAKEILKGNTAGIERQMLRKMQECAAKMQFEEAETIKQKYLLLENYRSRSEVVSNTLHNIDVFNIENNEKVAYINYLHVTNGCITQAFTFEYAKRMEETDEELLAAGIVEMRQRYSSESKEVIVPFPVKHLGDNLLVTVPQKGDKKKLLELSKLNVLQYKKDRLTQSDKLNPEQKQVRCLKELQDALGIETLPLHIECFDNSNISGDDAVAACIVFRKGKPSKKEYRKYNIKTVTGPDDYASMKEVVRRRYTRMINENTPLPNLIIADGGKGQMEVIREVVEDELNLEIPIAGLAKNEHHKTNELLFGFPQMSIGLRLDSALFHMITHIQDEVHRFAITFHRDKRSKRQTASELDTITGIGPKTKELLLKEFKSLTRIKKATLEELQKCIGESKGNTLFAYLNRQE